VYARLGLARSDYRVFEKDWGPAPPAVPPPLSPGTGAPRGLEIDFHCKSCGYNLRGSLGRGVLRCPECGQDNLAPDP